MDNMQGMICSEDMQGIGALRCCMMASVSANQEKAHGSTHAGVMVQIGAMRKSPRSVAHRIGCMAGINAKEKR
jgi:hypothetical protein